MERILIAPFRNVLIHGYADVDDRLVWDVVMTNLPLLARETAALLEQRPVAAMKKWRDSMLQSGPNPCCHPSA